MNAELREAIKTVGDTITGISSRFYFAEAPSGTAKPYLVFSKVTGIKTEDTASEFKDEYIQINGYGIDLEALEAIELDCKNKFDRQKASFTMTSYYCISIVMEFDRTAKLDNIYQFTQQYRIHVQKK